jgi:hypothetical protein
VDKPGYVEGKHFTAYVTAFRDLKRRKEFVALEALLLKLVDATEAEARVERWGVAPAYYEELAILYRKQKLPDRELAVLERYERQPKAPGVTPGRLAERLAKLRTKVARTHA